jgi:predicted nucleic acid-binding protein
MRKVVSNTTPILSLLKIEKLNLLRDLYGAVYVPYSVFLEIETGKDKEFYTNLKTVDWIKIEKIHSTIARDLLFDLDDGEAETLVLAQEINADLVIIDEKCGRRYAKQMGIGLTGTIGVLLKAKNNNLINTVAPLLNELSQKDVWLNRSLIYQALKLANEL